MTESDHNKDKEWWVKSEGKSSEDRDVSNWWVGLERAQSGPEEIARLRFLTKLRALQILPKGLSLFPDSDGPENPLLVEKTEKGVREMYKIYNEKLKDYEVDTFEGEKCDMRGGVGHKIHLNVEPSDVVRVSGYLKKEGFKHKYLHGGEIEDGKIFTVYFGSKDLAGRFALQFATDLRPYLRRPINPEEVEYAPNVVGRFVGDQKDFMQYGFGIRGFSMLRGHENLWQSEKWKRTMLPLAFEKSFEALAKKYGAYFYGTH